MKDLGIIVSSFPYGKGEPYLKEELDILSGYFQHIYILVPRENEGIQEEEHGYTLPENVSVIIVPVRNGRMDKLKKILSPLFFRILKLADTEFGKQKIKFSISKLKVLLDYILKGEIFSTSLLFQLKSRGVDMGSIVLYSYWFNEYAYSIYRVKVSYPDVHAYTRMHGWDVYYERHSPAYLPLRRYLLEGLDGCFPVSDHARLYTEERTGLNTSGIETYRLGTLDIPVQEFKPVQGELRILTLSYLVAIKNLELWIQALGNMDSLNVTWYHIGGGDPEYTLKIHSMAERILGSRTNIRFQFLGHISGQEVKDFFQTHPIDLLVNVSKDEGLPVSMMEALSAGIPVMATNVGGVKEIVFDGVNGFLLNSQPAVSEILLSLKKYHELSLDSKKDLRKNARRIWEERFSAMENYTGFARRISS